MKEKGISDPVDADIIIVDALMLVRRSLDDRGDLAADSIIQNIFTPMPSPCRGCHESLSASSR